MNCEIMPEAQRNDAIQVIKTVLNSLFSTPNQRERVKMSALIASLAKLKQMLTHLPPNTFKPQLLGLFTRVPPERMTLIGLPGHLVS